MEPVHSDHVQNDIEEPNDLISLFRSTQLPRELADWFNAPDAVMDHIQMCAKRNPRSGLWLIESAEFASWLEGKNSFIWLYGFAGSGKSVLCSTAIQYTFRHRRSKLGVGIAFFYFSFHDITKQDLSGMLRAIILQLSSQLNDGHSELAHLHQNYSLTTHPIPFLMQTLQRLLQRFQEVYLFLDALDECVQSTILNPVLMGLVDIRSWPIYNNLHIFVTSRDIVLVRQIIQGFGENIAMRNYGADRDIANFISEQLEENPSLKKWSAYKGRIQETLTARANGVFRWAECQLQDLAKCPRSAAALNMRLNSLPQSLDATYERILLNIEPQSLQAARRILLLLCFAKRPMTVEELIDGIAVELGDSPKLDLENRVKDEIDILELCPGLIELAFDSKSNHKKLKQSAAKKQILRIAHFSVQEYLMSDRILRQSVSSFGMNYATAHTEMAQICLIYLLDVIKLDDNLTESTFDKRPLALYAAENWFKYYERSAKTVSKTQEFIISLFESQPHFFQNWIRIHDLDRPDRGPNIYRTSDEIPSAVYYASLLGLDFVLARLIEANSADVNMQGGEYGNALQAASSQNYKRAVQLLLAGGADVNAQGGNHGNALQAASFGGYKAIVQLLIDQGADVNTQGGAYSDTLRRVYSKGYKDIVQLFLDRCENDITNVASSGNALHVASYKGHKDVVQLLLDRGAAVNAQGGTYGNALQAASLEGYKEITQILIESGAEVNAQGGAYGNALQAASLSGSKEVTQILIESGADVNAQGGAYGNALQAASLVGSKEITHLLLEYGADVNAQGGPYNNALQAASLRGYEDVVILLLDLGADVNAQGGAYSNALQAALLAGYKDVVQLLLDRGANPKEQGEHGDRLQEGSYKDDKDVVWLLRERHSDRSRQTMEGGQESLPTGIHSSTQPQERPAVASNLPPSIFKAFFALIRNSLRPKIPAGHKRIEWTCSCGDEMYADFKASSPESLELLASRLGGIHNESLALADMEEREKPVTRHLATKDRTSEASETNFSSHVQASLGAEQNRPGVSASSSWQNSSSDQNQSSSNDPHTSIKQSEGSTSNEIGTYASGKIQEDSSRKKFLMVIARTGKWTHEMGEIDVSGLRSDRVVFESIRSKYYNIRRSLPSMGVFKLREPARGEFVKFRVDRSPSVGIIGSPVIPPEEEVREGRYKYDPVPLDEPAIPSNVFMHYFTKVTEAHNEQHWITRFPTKLDQSVFYSNERLACGWGIKIEEGPSWMGCSLLTLMMLLISGIVSGVYGYLKNDASTAVAIGAWITSIQGLCIASLFFWWTDKL